jgi:branched-subunit amino acid transport protein AzlD
MIFVRQAVLVCCIILAGCIVGVLLQRFLPTQHMTDAKTAITTIQGLVTLLLALVLGLLVWTSYGVYSQQQSEAYTLGSQTCSSI